MKLWTLFFCVLLVQCQEHTPQMQYLSTIIDLTEENSSAPSPDEVLSFLGGNHPSDGIELSLRYVTETRYAQRHQFVLPIGDTGWLSNEHDRRSKHKQLLSRFGDTICHHQRKVRFGSEIFRLVVEEVVYLSDKQGDRQVLLCSDLKQHSSLYSVYDVKQLDKLYRDGDSVVAHFASVVPEVDLNGINVHILFTPELRDDRLFTTMVDVYRKVLEPLGATVKVSNNRTLMIRP